MYRNNYIFFVFNFSIFCVGVVAIPFESFDFLQGKNPQILIAFHLNEYALETWIDRKKVSIVLTDWTESVGVGGIHFIGLFDVKSNDIHFSVFMLSHTQKISKLFCDWSDEFPHAM